jgi:hypothetical protein
MEFQEPAEEPALARLIVVAVVVVVTVVRESSLSDTKSERPR